MSTLAVIEIDPIVDIDNQEEVVLDDNVDSGVAVTSDHFNNYENTCDLVVNNNVNSTTQQQVINSTSLSSLSSLPKLPPSQQPPQPPNYENISESQSNQQLSQLQLQSTTATTTPTTTSSPNNSQNLLASSCTTGCSTDTVRNEQDQQLQIQSSVQFNHQQLQQQDQSMKVIHSNSNSPKIVLGI